MLAGLFTHHSGSRRGRNTVEIKLALTVVERNALVPFSPAQMYALVADVESYARFLPWCQRATVHEQDEEHMKASLVVAKGPLRKSFTTINHLTPNEGIDIELVEGPFRRLNGQWRFEELGDAGCKVSFNLRFEFTSRLLSATLGPLFNEIAGTMVHAFARRANDVYKRSDKTSSDKTT
jgi:ribosome-associated toxin RatA of RatAB toxin-antitoxin module